MSSDCVGVTAPCNVCWEALLTRITWGCGSTAPGHQNFSVGFSRHSFAELIVSQGDENGYARVSTAAQDEGGQVKQLKAAGCGKIYCEKITGTHASAQPIAELEEDAQFIGLAINLATPSGQ